MDLDGHAGGFAEDADVGGVVEEGAGGVERSWIDAAQSVAEVHQIVVASFCCGRLRDEAVVVGGMVEELIIGIDEF